MLVLAALLFAACVTQPTGNVVGENVKEPIIIGVVGPFTGDGAMYGDATVGGIKLAIKEINAAGGVNGRMLEVIYEDDKCSPTEGTSAFTKLVRIDDVDVIVGPVCSGVAAAGVPIAQASGTPVIITAASAPGLAKGDDSIFRVYPSDAFQGKFDAEYAYDTLGARNVAIIYTQNAWGQGIHDVFVERFTELGGKIVVDEGFAQGTTDVRTAVAKLQTQQPDVIITPVWPSTATALLKQLQEADVTQQVIGGDAWDTQELHQLPVADGARYTVTSYGLPEEFKARVRTVSDKEQNVVTPFAYDAVKLYAHIAAQVGTEKAAVVEALKTVEYDGISGRITFDENGDLSSAGFQVKEIRDGKAVVIVE
jgi:branched-chain amino acid transport system substrate-binding protein